MALQTGTAPADDDSVVLWEQRAVLLSAFGIVGIGAFIGSLSVYANYIKHRLEEHFQIQSVAGKLHDESGKPIVTSPSEQSSADQILRSRVFNNPSDKQNIDGSSKQFQVTPKTEVTSRSGESSPVPARNIPRARSKIIGRRSLNVLNPAKVTSPGPVKKIRTGSRSPGRTSRKSFTALSRSKLKPDVLSNQPPSLAMTVIYPENSSSPAPAPPFKISLTQESADVEESRAVTDQRQVQQFFQRIDDLLEGSKSNQHEAYITLKTNNEKLGNRYDFLWRFARATHIESVVAAQQQDKETQKSLLLDAVSYAEKAMKLNETSADAHKWYAITLGNHSEFLKVKDRILVGFTFKEHVERALVLNPADSFLHHLLGRFCFEVAQLSWVERKMAAALFSTPPTATVPEALAHFLDAESIGKPTIENRLYIAKCYISMSDNKKAANYLNLASSLIPISFDDKKAFATVMELLPKYRKYL